MYHNAVLRVACGVALLLLRMPELCAVGPSSASTGASSASGSQYTPGACGAVRPRCSAHSDCGSPGCGYCWCFGTMPNNAKPNASVSCAHVADGTPMYGDAHRGYCDCAIPGPDGRYSGDCTGENNATLPRCGACSGLGARTWMPQGSRGGDLGCGGPPMPIEAEAAGRLQYLSIGDSVGTIIWYSGLNASLVDNSSNIYPYMPGINCGSTSEGANCIWEWLGADLERWDIISVNFGWHDTQETYSPQGIVKFKQQLANVTQVIMQTKAGRNKKLVWVSTNQLPDIPKCVQEGHARSAMIAELNQIAWEYLEPLGWTLVDLAAAGIAQCGPPSTWGMDKCPLANNQTDQTCNVHPTRAGGALYANLIANAVKKLAAE